MFERQPKASTGLNSKVHLLHKANTLRLEEVAISSMHRNQHRRVKQNLKKKSNFFQTKE